MLIDSNLIIHKLQSEINRWKENVRALDLSEADNDIKVLEAEAVILGFSQAISLIQRQVMKQSRI